MYTGCQKTNLSQPKDCLGWQGDRNYWCSIDVGHPHPCWLATMHQASCAVAAMVTAGTGKITLTPNCINPLHIIPFYHISRRWNCQNFAGDKGSVLTLLQLRICPVKRCDSLSLSLSLSFGLQMKRLSRQIKRNGKNSVIVMLEQPVLFKVTLGNWRNLYRLLSWVLELVIQYFCFILC